MFSSSALTAAFVHISPGESVLVLFEEGSVEPGQATITDALWRSPSLVAIGGKN